MLLSFDLYPQYLKRFSGAFNSKKATRLRYQIHAMRNYAYRTENGKRTGPFPQVRPEGSLELETNNADLKQSKTLQVRHIRSWSTWTNQKHSSAQTLEARIRYEAKNYGHPSEWDMRYRSDPVLPVKSYRYTATAPFQHKGFTSEKKISIQGDSKTPIEYKFQSPLSTFYTLIDCMQSGAVKPGTIDYLDDLTMFRPGLNLLELPDQTIEIEGTPTDLHGFALAGPAILPLYFWMDSQSRILAIIGRNVAYTLTHAENS